MKPHVSLADKTRWTFLEKRRVIREAIVPLTSYKGRALQLQLQLQLQQLIPSTTGWGMNVHAEFRFLISIKSQPWAGHDIHMVLFCIWSATFRDSNSLHSYSSDKWACLRCWYCKLEVFDVNSILHRKQQTDSRGYPYDMSNQWIWWNYLFDRRMLQSILHNRK